MMTTTTMVMTKEAWSVLLKAFDGQVVSVPPWYSITSYNEEEVATAAVVLGMLEVERTVLHAFVHAYYEKMTWSLWTNSS